MSSATWKCPTFSPVFLPRYADYYDKETFRICCKIVVTPVSPFNEREESFIRITMLEDYPAAEKILSDIMQILQKDPKLNTVEIIPQPTCSNKNPVYHEQHSLGLESWCVQPVYCHAYQSIMNMRQNKQRSRDLKRMDSLLVGVLMINPSITTFWNMRKDLINHGKLDPYFELHFTSVVLSRKPKSPDVYTHRKWILNKIFKDYNEKSKLLADEMYVCEAAANRYSNNYHAWTHRLWCLNQGIPLQSNSAQFFLQELNWSQSWILTHVSDHSGLHYRQQVLAALCVILRRSASDSVGPLFSPIENAFDRFCNAHQISCDSPNSLKIVIFELGLNTGMINDFVAHEALWYHRRFIFNLFKTQWLPASDSEENENWPDIALRAKRSNGDGVPMVKTQKIESYGFKFITELISYETAFLKQFNSENSDEASRKYASRHQQWLTYHLKLNDFCGM